MILIAIPRKQQKYFLHKQIHIMLGLKHLVFMLIKNPLKQIIKKHKKKKSICKVFMKMQISSTIHSTYLKETEVKLWIPIISEDNKAK